VIQFTRDIRMILMMSDP